MVRIIYSYTIHGALKTAIFIYIKNLLFKHPNSSFHKFQIAETKCHKRGDTL